MTWEQRYRLGRAARTSLVLWAGAALLAAVVVAPCVRWLARATDAVVFGFSPDSARAVLAALAGSMLTFLVFVLSATLIVVQLASGQLTPRVIALVLASPSVKVALGGLTFTYAYTLSALGRADDAASELHVAVAIFLNLGCILLFFQFVQQLSSGLRPGALLLLVARHGERVIDQVYPVEFDPARPESETGPTLPVQPSRVVSCTGHSGVIMAVGVDELVRLAEEADVVVELVPQVGDFISRGDALFRIGGGMKPIAAESLHGCVAIGAERTLDQDPRFVFRILVDIANKALSPAINDPTTAVLALDQIEHLLLVLGRRRLDEGVVRDSAGTVRFVIGTPDWPDYMILAVSEIRQFGQGSIQVSRRLRAMLEHLIACLPASRHGPLQTELSILESGVARTFANEEDRKRASVADYQGVGGADS